MMIMAKTQAIKIASKAIKMSGRGTSWVITGPYHESMDGLSGPSTDTTATDFFMARRKRTAWAASLALSLMDKDNEGYFAHMAEQEGSCSVASIVNRAIELENLKKTAEKPKTGQI